MASGSILVDGETNPFCTSVRVSRLVAGIVLAALTAFACYYCLSHFITHPAVQQSTLRSFCWIYVGCAYGGAAIANVGYTVYKLCKGDTNPEINRTKLGGQVGSSLLAPIVAPFLALGGAVHLIVTRCIFVTPHSTG